METISEQDLRDLQARLDAKQEGRIFHQEDMEVIGVVEHKNLAQQQAAALAAQQLRNQNEARIRQIREMEEESIRMEEEAEAIEEECRQDMHQASVVSGVLFALGGLYLIGPKMPDVSFTAGGLLLLAAMTVFGIGFIRWHWGRQ